jgi:hypothetical protein
MLRIAAYDERLCESTKSRPALGLSTLLATRDVGTQEIYALNVKWP